MIRSGAALSAGREAGYPDLASVLRVDGRKFDGGWPRFSSPLLGSSSNCTSHFFPPNFDRSAVTWDGLGVRCSAQAGE